MQKKVFHLDTSKAHVLENTMQSCCDTHQAELIDEILADASLGVGTRGVGLLPQNHLPQSKMGQHLHLLIVCNTGWCQWLGLRQALGCAWAHCMGFQPDAENAISVRGATTWFTEQHHGQAP